MTRLVIPGITTLIVVASWVALAGWNRSGTPRLTLTVTERELALVSPVGDSDADSSGVQLRFDFEPRHDPLDARNWLTEDRLRALGFELNLPVASPEAEQSYSRALPRIGWVVFEYSGTAWQEIERRRQVPVSPSQGALDSTDHARHGPSIDPSRLVPIDAGPDLEALTARYPTGHLIVRASVGLRYLPANQRGPLVYGIIQELLPSAVTVPARLRDRLAGFGREPQAAASQPPRYEVDLAVGRLGIPYIRDVQRRELIADPH